MPFSERTRLGGPFRVDPDGGEAVAVRRALDALPEKQRRIVVMRYVLDLSAEQTGTALGMSAGAVRMQCHRALASLHSTLAEAPELTEEVADGS